MDCGHQEEFRSAPSGRLSAWAGLGETDNALNDLQQAVSISDALRRHARAEEMFVPLRDLERFQELVGRPEDDPEIAL